jgi:hypothetical protein
MVNVSRPRRPKQPATFRITFHIGEDVYAVVPLTAVHPEVAVKAFRFHKHTGDGATYDVRLTSEGHVECDCRGFERWRKPCKHVRTLTAAGMLPAVEAPLSVA